MDTLVDLDGALSGKNENQKAIKKVLQRQIVRVQLGGGIRSLDIIEDWINLGVSRSNYRNCCNIE